LKLETAGTGVFVYLWLHRAAAAMAVRALF
jgi:hypothetical protein